MAVEGSAGDLVKVVTLLGAAVVAVPLFKRIGLGSVLGYLAAGLAIGPFGFGLFTDPQTILPVDEQGIQVELIPDGTRLIYVTPSHQFPLGMPMSRHQIIDGRPRRCL